LIVQALYALVFRKVHTFAKSISTAPQYRHTARKQNQLSTNEIFDMPPVVWSEFHLSWLSEGRDSVGGFGRGRFCVNAIHCFGCEISDFLGMLCKQGFQFR
jgi:hypothetical protein